MSHFAQVINGIVERVIVVEQDVLDTGAFGDPSTWIQTSYNTRGGQHLLNGTPLRKNYAGIGYVYDAQRDAFYAPQPYPSWILDEETCYWLPPVSRPISDLNYTWNEETLSWEEITL